MTKVYCCDVTCEFCNEKGVCTQKSICLGYRRVNTVYDGLQDYNKCKSYQKSQRAIQLEKLFQDMKGETK